ncbi:MAG: LLM class flavin-dependent oxidoreductase [Alphaproteobacteria bacterium]
MDFSLFYLPTYRAGFSPSLAAFYGEMLQSVKLADRLGWARVLTTEHHFHYYGGAVPNPAVILAAWARETKRIRLSAGVSLVPLRHPLQVAEDYALVDHLSEGRFDMGVSRGFVPHEFDAFGVSQAETAERVMEALDIIRKFWAGQPFAYDGKFTKFARIDPWPQTFQQEIPIWVAASNDLASFARAGAGGYHLMMNQYPMSFASLVEKHTAYKDAYAKAGHDPKKQKSAIAFLVHLADTEEKAIAEAKGWVQEHAAAFRKVQTHDEWNRDYAYDESILLGLGEPDVRELFRKRTLVGTPAQAAERLRKYIDLGFTEAIFVARYAGVPAAQERETIERLTREVRPMLGLKAAA